ncbi:MAG: glycosyltransferase family 4 protein [Burkholderiales bacterium]
MKLGHDVVVITSDRRSYNFGDKHERVVGIGIFFDNGVRIERIPIKGEFAGRFVLFKDLMGVLEKEKPDYIFHHGLPCPSLQTSAKYKSSSKNVILVADNHAEYHNSGKIWIWRFLYYRIFWKNKISNSINAVNKFFSITPACRFFAERELGVPSVKHELLYLGSDVDNIHFNFEWRKNIRDYYGFNESDVVIVTAGKIDKGKKVDEIIQSLQEIKASNIKCIIIGSIERGYVKKLKELIGNDKRIIKVGWIETHELFKYLSAADIAVFPGGQSVLWQQAISCELPVIFRYWPGTEYLLLKENGLFLFSNNYRELRQYLEILLKSPELRKKMRLGAVKECDEVISYYIIAKQSLNII